MDCEDDKGSEIGAVRLRICTALPTLLDSAVLRDEVGELFLNQGRWPGSNAPAGFRPVAPRAGNGRDTQARSSGGEHYLDTVGVSGSNPLEPTNSSRRRRLAQLEERYLHTVEVNGSIPLAPTREETTTRGNPRF